MCSLRAHQRCILRCYVDCCTHVCMCAEIHNALLCQLEKEALKRAISIMHHKFAGDNMEIYDGDDGNPIEPEDDELECRENLFERGSMGPLGPLAQHHELAMVVAVEFSKFLCLTYDVSPPLSTSIKKRHPHPFRSGLPP